MKSKYILIYILLVFVCQAKSFNPDSLLKVWLDRSNPDSVRIKAMYLHSFKYLQSNPDSAEKMAKAGAELAFKIKNPKMHANFLNTIGGANFYRGNYSKAIDYYYLAEKIFTEINSKTGIASSLINIASVFYANKDYKKAIEYYSKAEKLLDPKKDINKLIGIYLGMGATYSNDKQFDLAKKFLQLTVAKRKLLKDSVGIAQGQSQLIIFYLNQNNTDSAYPLFENTFRILTKYNDDYGLMYCNLYMGDYYTKTQKPKESIQYYRYALKYAERLNYGEPKKDAYLGLYESYKLINTDSALANYLKYTLWKDSLQNENTSNEIIKQQLTFEYDKQKVIDEKEKENQLALSNEKERRQKLIILFSISGFIVVLIFTFFVINRLRVTKKQKLLIVEQKHLVDEKQKEILDSLQYAKQIQKTLLANHKLVNETLPDSFVVFKPKDIVSGDFYWAAKRDDYFYLAVCDSTGHGVPGAFMSLLNINFLNEAVNEKKIVEPNEIFNYVRKRLIDSLSQQGRQDGMDGILICLNCKTNNLSYAAANNAPLIIKNDELTVLDADKMPIGKGEKQDQFNLYKIAINKGDQLYLYTDGYADQFGGPKGKKFKYKPLNSLILKNNQMPVLKQEEELYKELENWQGSLEQVDDVCILGIKF